MKKRYLAKALSERERIVQNGEQRPYGVRVHVAVSNGFRGEALLGIEHSASLLFDDELVINIKRYERIGEVTIWWEYDLTVEAFATAGEAEAAGLRMAHALLWTSVSVRDPNIMLRYRGPLPCDVYDRRKMGGSVDGGFVTVTTPPNLQFQALVEGWRLKQVDRHLLLALELYSAALFETSTRARFIGLVSALEPLAMQRRYDTEAYGSEIEAVIAQTVSRIEQCEHVPDAVKRSLIGRVRDLRRESVRHAYLRFAAQHLSQFEVKALDEAYSLRSEMLHEGNSDPDLTEVTGNVEALVRKVLSGAMGLQCVIPVPQLVS